MNQNYLKAYISSLENNYLNNIEQGLNWIDFGGLVSKNSKVFIKPNLTYPNYRPGVMTNPDAIEAAIKAIMNFTNNIYIGDSDSGGYNRFSMDEVYKSTGIMNFAQKYGANVVNLSSLPRRTIKFEIRNKQFKLDLPRLLTDDIDLFITMPVPKIHNNTGVSLSFKNQWGCIPEPKDRLRLHPYFKEIVLEVNKAIKTQIVIMDGKYGLNRNGPLRGKAAELGWLLISNTPGVAVRIALELMQIKLENIAHLKHARSLNLIPELESIALNQELKPFIKDRFFLERDWTDFPGLLAFNSPLIAYIAYFSPLANFLHKFLYLFREPFYDYEKHKI